MENKKTILIVDDDPSNIELMADVLSDYKRIVALSGNKALELALSQKPDLILLDIVMPDLSGLEVCKALKSNPNTTEIPIVFVTAKDQINDEIKGFEIGAFDYISKPISPPIVKARIKNILNYMDSKEKIKENLQQLKKSQNQLILNEKLVSLGNLVASIAHEVNSPLGALISSNELALDYAERIFISNLESTKLYNAIEINYIKNIIKKLILKEKTIPFKEIREIKNKLTEELEKYTLSVESYEVIEFLIEANIYEIDNDLINLLKSNNLEFLIENLTDIISLINIMKTIKTSSNQINKIVDALRNYSRYNSSNIESINSIDITQGIDTVLTIFNSKIKRDVIINKKYLFQEKINCNPSQLIQVWTNLIQNSLQAMNYKGILDISTEQENNFVVIKIKDDGIGIKEEIRDRIFEPFYTTKSLGEGTGLGLDIVKNIILKHNGTINFESTPGIGTTFIIKIPIN